MKALEILKRIYINNPDTRFQRNNIDINFTIHDFSNVNEAIKELEEKLNVANKVICMQCENQAEMGNTIDNYEKQIKNLTNTLIAETEHKNRVKRRLALSSQLRNDIYISHMKDLDIKNKKIFNYRIVCLSLLFVINALIAGYFL